MIRRGFTIVELLIVIVVIGILVAIIVVSYKGITESALQSQVKANATELAQALSTYKVSNSNGENYPLGTNNGGSISNLRTLANIPNSIEVDAYLTDPSGNNYCITTTSNAGSVTSAYSVSSTASTPIRGVCVENLILNPKPYGSASNLCTVTTSDGATCVLSSDKSNPYVTITTTDNTKDSGWETWSRVGDYSLSYLFASVDVKGNGSVKTSRTDSVQENGGSWRSLLVVVFWPTTFSANWTTYGAVSGLTPGDTWQSFRFFARGGSNVGDSLVYRYFMLVKTSTISEYSYGDGDSAGWFWTGPPNNSTSIGPAVVQ